MPPASCSGQQTAMRWLRHGFKVTLTLLLILALFQAVTNLSSLATTFSALAMSPVRQNRTDEDLRQSNQTVPNLALLESRFAPFLGSGGDYRPKDSQAGQRVAIIIAYRNRWRHLLVLLNNLVPFLVRQHVSFTIFVIDQVPPMTFNRGMLQNIGFAEALKRDNYTCFILHDVDLIPLNDLNYYRCGPQPRHMAVGISKFNYTIIYQQYFGGVVALSRDQMERINGNSNLYFGWGGEDDELSIRVFNKGMKVDRYPESIAKYDMIEHERDSGNKKNPLRLKLMRSSKRRMDVDGLNSLRYTVEEVQTYRLATWIKVSIDQHRVIQSAPVWVQKWFQPINIPAKSLGQGKQGQWGQAPLNRKQRPVREAKSPQ